jgi:hypothetical protein
MIIKELSNNLFSLFRQANGMAPDHWRQERDRLGKHGAVQLEIRRAVLSRRSPDRCTDPFRIDL